jgi:drug/metabolite transporter (DMT)-like permease
VKERAGVLAAVVSSALGGTAGAITRHVIGATDPVTLAAFRFGIAFVLKPSATAPSRRA